MTEISDNVDQNILTEKERQAEDKKKKWVNVQKKAFLHWVNTYLGKVDAKIEDLITGFSDGVKLIQFLEQLTRRDIVQKYSKIPKLRVHKITNCYIAVKHLNDLGVSGLTVQAEDIVDASDEKEVSVNLILGFCWMLLRRFQTTPDMGDGNSKESSFETRILNWVKETLVDYKDITITSWDSFKDGKALLALVEQFDKNLINYQSFNKDDPTNTAKTALSIAESKINIPSDVIDVDELVGGQIQEKNLVLYTTLFYNAFSDKVSLTSRESLVRRLHQLEEEIELLYGEKGKLENMKKFLEEKRFKLNDEMKVVVTERDELLKWKTDNTEEWERQRKNLKERIIELQENIDMLNNATTESSNKLAQTNEKIKGECEELTKKKETLHKDKEELTEKMNTLNREYNNEKGEREKLEEAVAKQQNESGLNLSSLRKKLQSYVWDDMYAWNVLLEIKTDISPEDFHREKVDEIRNQSFVDQIKAISAEVEKENSRLVDLHAERLRESARNEGDSEEETTKPPKSGKKEEKEEKAPKSGKKEEKTTKTDKGEKKQEKKKN